MEFRIADSFTASLLRLPAREQKAAKTTAFDLQLDRSAPGLRFHRVEHGRDPNFWTVRVNDGLRIVVHTTDVGWTPLFLIAAGVVTELGGPLSHAAVVAREFGVPSVVNVSGITRAIRTGDRLRVDGDRGVVERLGRS